MTRLRRSAGAAASVLGLLLLTGCGVLSPGTAAVVDGSSIKKSEVNRLADAQCAGIKAAIKQGGSQPVSRGQLSRQALQLLIDIKLSLHYGASQHLHPRPAEVQADYSQVKPLIDALPEKYHASLQKIFTDWANGRDMVKQVGERSGAQQAGSSGDDAALTAGSQRLDAWAKKVTIHTDPIYSPGKNGQPGQGDSSVSSPVSGFAKAAAAAQESPSFVASLPASQRCG